MPRIHFHHKDQTVQTVDAPVGLSVMEVAVKNKVVGIEGACGGGLACATCHVYVHPGWVTRVLPNYNAGTGAGEAITDDENDMLDLAFDLRKTSRLSCQIIVRDDLDGLVVALPGARPEWLA
jgi:ferredoxin, 2Fe-2S